MSREKDPSSLRIHSRFFLAVTLLPVVFVALFLIIPLVSVSGDKERPAFALVLGATGLVLVALLYLARKGDLNADTRVHGGGSQNE